MNDNPTTELTWDPPGPGTWTFDGSHVPGAPTAMYTALHIKTIGDGLAAVFERYGIPLEKMDERVVNGRLYTRLRPVVGPDKESSKPPPAAVLWLATRLHPLLRRKARIAEQAFEQRVWRKGVERWHNGLEADLVARNRALQQEDLGSLDDAALADHVRRIHAHVVETMTLHFDLHGDDLGPIGDFIAHCQDWGIDIREAVMALEGSSPASNAAAEHIARIRAAVDAHGGTVPDSVDALRALGPDVAARSRRLPRRVRVAPRERLRHRRSCARRAAAARSSSSIESSAARRSTVTARRRSRRCARRCPRPSATSSTTSSPKRGSCATCATATVP